MSTAAGRRRAGRAAIRRRRITALGALAAAAVAIGLLLGRGGGGGGGSEAEQTSAPPPAVVEVRLGGSTLVRSNVHALTGSREQSRALASLPAQRVERSGKARITYDVDTAAAARSLARAVRAGGGTVTVPEQPVAAAITVPLIGQRLKNDCEATALSMVLGYAGRPVDQMTLQRQVAHAKPLDPETGPHGEEIWGDPNTGFVGRADGGGPAGGFGVYQGPIRALAARHDLKMAELSGGAPQRVYAALLQGRPVLAWVALSEGPYSSWTSPAGRSIEVNYGEHAVVLTGVGEGTVQVNDPLSGERLTWSKSQFEQMWDGLGHRALAA